MHFFDFPVLGFTFGSAHRTNAVLSLVHNPFFVLCEDTNRQRLHQLRTMGWECQFTPIHYCFEILLNPNMPICSYCSTILDWNKNAPFSNVCSKESLIAGGILSRALCLTNSTVVKKPRSISGNGIEKFLFPWVCQYRRSK